MRLILCVSLVFLLALCSCGLVDKEGLQPVSLVLHNAKIWTGDPYYPWAEWVAVSGDKILDMGTGKTHPHGLLSLDMQGRLVVPGFNDSHVHFASAGSLLLGVNLLDVNDDEKFRARIAEAAARLPENSWITGGDWGAYEAWAVGSDGKKSNETKYVPSRALIDEATPEHPVLVRRFDRKMGLANARALKELGIESRTGILEGEALAKALQGVPKKSFERRLAETRRGLLECRKWGVTSVQDMSSLDQVDIYEYLRERGELTCRIHFSPARLPDYRMMVNRKWTIGAGDEWLRFGTIKTHIDGIMGGRSARFFKPYSDNSPDKKDWRGGWREFSRDLKKFEEMLTDADKHGIQLRVHAIGDEANSLALDMFGRIEKKNGPRDRRFRLVHAQVMNPKEFERLPKPRIIKTERAARVAGFPVAYLKDHRRNLIIKDQDIVSLSGSAIVAEVQPYHCTDDMRWMEERIGHDRCVGAYAFKTLLVSGCILASGSDWPGTNASYYPVNPLYGIYAAVTRQTIKGTPSEGWFPNQRISLKEALRAYTHGGAYASFEDRIKGTLERGKLADMAVLDTDLFSAPPSEWLKAKVDYTIVGGTIVYYRRK